MQADVEVREIRSLKEFQKFLKPIVQNNNDNSQGHVNGPGKISIDVDPAMIIKIACDEFIDNLPSEYKQETDFPNVMLNSRRKIEIGKPVPIAVLISIMKKMETLIIG